MPRTAQMHRVVRIDTAHSLVRAIFHDVASWSLWMPEVTLSEVLERELGRVRARFRQTALGKSWTQTVDVELDENQVRLQALDGLIRWHLEWSFRQPPDGRGTTLWMKLEMKAGGLGLASGALFQKMNERRFGATLDALRLRAGRLEAQEVVSREGRRLLTVYETSEGFEVWYEGRKYIARNT